ncbi:acetyl-CoA hydrolase/transferase C-terminal domain-containing protein [Halobellus captivus]|uniref:acetyl-CoA hydrolase/transferase C-terminal domain-containing protein n=1 Tax=Halobellus captivus TaxID=2592614 RepID=UPI001EF05648|nr:acetyl-CoA hydrolase/transferase C-terminal domain-containing protein [Halobellus captivus]
MTVENRINGALPIQTATEAASKVPSEATVLVSGFGSVGYPKAVPLALAESAQNHSLTVISGGSVGEEIDEALVTAEKIERRFPYQSQPQLRAAINENRVAYHDRNVSDVADELQYGNLADPDIAIIEAIAVGEDWLIPSTSIGQTPAFVESVDQLIVEVNSSQPLALQAVHDIYRPGPPPEREPIPLSSPGDRIGQSKVEFSPDALCAVVETDRADSPYSFRSPTETDRAIATQFGEFVREEMERSSVYDDSLRLQFGVGSLGNALMGELNEMSFDGREVIYYGEVIQDGLLDMIDSGRLSSTSATSLALSEDGQKRLFEDIDRYSENIVLRPTDVSNNGAVIDRFGVMAVNSAVEVDIYGNVNSTHVGGTTVLNGIGGSADFNQNALVAVCTLPSVLADKGISRIVPKAEHIDHTEHDIDVVVTEQGVADLRGLSPLERATEIIESCAHPDHRDSLREYLQKAKTQGGHIPHTT